MTVTIPAGGRLYDVIFKQSGDWYSHRVCCAVVVTLDPGRSQSRLTRPSRLTLPKVAQADHTPTISTIAFSVPNGRYNYSIAMGWNLGNPTGVVNVDGTGMMILVQGPSYPVQ